MEKKRLCREHNQPIRVLCEECEDGRVYCCVCYVEHQIKVHNNKRACYVEDKIPKYLSQIETNLAEAAQWQKEINKCRPEVFAARGKAAKQIFRARQEIVEAERQLEKRRREIMECETEVAKSVEKALEMLERQEVEIDERTGKARKEIEEIKRLEGTGDMEEALDGCRKLLEKSKFVGDKKGIVPDCFKNEKKLAKLCGKKVKVVITTEPEAKDIAPPLYTGYYPYDGGNQVKIYNTTTQKTITIKFDYPHPEGRSSSIIVKNDFYIFGGDKPTSPAVYLIPISEEGAECKAIKKADLSVPRSRIGLAQHANNFIYALGGRDGKGSSACCEKYDISKNEWTTIASLNEPKQSISGCEMSQTIYSIGGWNEKGSCATIERLNIAGENEGWKKLQIENSDKTWTPRSCCGCFRMNENTILVFGGNISESGYDVVKTDRAFYMQIINGSALISLASAEMKKSCYFLLNNNCTFNNGEIYSILDADRDIHAYNLTTKEWKLTPNPW